MQLEYNCREQAITLIILPHSGNLCNGDFATANGPYLSEGVIIKPMKECTLVLILLCISPCVGIAQSSSGKSEVNAQGCIDGAGVGPGHVGGELSKDITRPKPTYSPEP